jgi:hypothetical protein
MKDYLSILGLCLAVFLISCAIPWLPLPDFVKYVASLACIGSAVTAGVLTLSLPLASIYYGAKYVKQETEAEKRFRANVQAIADHLRKQTAK